MLSQNSIAIFLLLVFATQSIPITTLPSQWPVYVQLCNDILPITQLLNSTPVDVNAVSISIAKANTTWHAATDNKEFAPLVEHPTSPQSDVLASAAFYSCADNISKTLCDAVDRMNLRLVAAGKTASPRSDYCSSTPSSQAPVVQSSTPQPQQNLPPFDGFQPFGSATVTFQKKTKVVFVKQDTGVLPAWSTQAAYTASFTHSQAQESILDIYKRLSFGKIDFVGLNSQNVDYTNWMSFSLDTYDSLKRSESVGYDLVVYVVAEPNSGIFPAGASGVAPVWSKESQIQAGSYYTSTGTNSYSTPIHEIGHCLGLAHANKLTCDWTKRGAEFTSSCRSGEYSDSSDFMGGKHTRRANTNMYNRVLMGVIDESYFIDGSSSGTFTIRDTNTDAGSTDMSSLVIIHRITPLAIGTVSVYNNLFVDRYYVELLSDNKDTQIICKVYVRLVLQINKTNGFYEGFKTGLLVSTLGKGETWDDPINKVKFVANIADDCLTASIQVLNY